MHSKVGAQRRLRECKGHIKTRESSSVVGKGGRVVAASGRVRLTVLEQHGLETKRLRRVWR